MMRSAVSCLALVLALALALLALVVSSSLAAAPPHAQLAALEAAYTHTGKFERCLSLAEIDDIDVIDRQHLLFRVGVNRRYLNKLPRACHALTRSSGVLIETRHTRLCDIDWVRVLRPFAGRGARLRGPACGLGQFELLEPGEADSDGSAIAPAVE